MFGCRSGIIVLVNENTYTNMKTTHPIWLKLIVAALMNGVFTVTTTLVQGKISDKQRQQIDSERKKYLLLLIVLLIDRVFLDRQ